MVVAAYTAQSSRTKARFAGEFAQFSCLRSEQRHASRPDAGVEDRSGDQPGGPYTPATVAHRDVPALEGSQLCYGKAALAVAAWRQAIDCQVEAGQLVQLRMETRCPRADEFGGSHWNI